MFLGTSLVHCLSDILDGTIVQDDVFAIISTNQFDISNHQAIDDWYSISLTQYNISQNPLNKLINFTEKEVTNLFRDLVYQGVIINRLHAKRFHTASLRLEQNKHWYALCLVPDDMTPAVKEAWDHYKLLEKICKD